ncbi:uncharacterized protein LOC134835146 [Culicoides brevitarsis]|uniref:uncharacterized protein LOC134835146 n=1 Tax=Culicoides brevitarsis TaxID=469753 RepID=UPI00307C6BB1
MMNTTSSKRSLIDDSKRKQPEKPEQKQPSDRSLRILSGNVEFALRCAKMLPSTSSILLEIFGTVISVRPGGRSEMIILLRNDGGPILRLSYHEVQFPLPSGLKDVRCICRINSDGGFQAFKLVPTEFCYEYIQRLQAISVHFLKKFVETPALLE